MSRQPGPRGERSRERLLDCALELAAERGYDGTSIASLSQRSGLPPSSIYWYFDSKDELLAAALEHGMAHWLERMAEVSGSPVGTLPEAAQDRLRRAAQAATAAPAFWHFGLMLSLEDRVQEPQARRRFAQAHRDVVEYLGSWWAGLLPPTLADRPARGRRLGELHVALLDGFYLAHAAGRGWDLERLASLVARGVVAQVQRWERDALAG